MENQPIKKEIKKPNTSPDKREMMLFREVLKIIFIALIFSLIWGVVLTQSERNYVEINTNLQKTNNELVKKLDSVNVNKTIQQKKEINYNNLCVVIKTSKDIRKYFVSYKKYYSKDKYRIIIREINFTEYMTLSPNDTLTNIHFYNGK
jgi:hypothetical protein